jgi:rare lipoprotein A
MRVIYRRSINMADGEWLIRAVTRSLLGFGEGTADLPGRFSPMKSNILHVGLVSALLAFCINSHVCAHEPDAQRNTAANREADKTAHHEPDFTASKRVGKASFYAREFSGKTMADGVKMDPEGDNAASKTLPLGTTAKVTNIETGKSAVVTIEDRGPYVPDRIVDLSPATARAIGLSKRQGVAKVVVAPIAVPQPDGKLKLGVAAHETLEEPAPIREAALQAQTQSAIEATSLRR